MQTLLTHIRDDTKDSDYASPSTIPVKGETLNEGNFKRKFAQRLLEVCMKVSFKKPRVPLEKTVQSNVD